MSLSKKECVPCKGGIPPLKGEELDQLERTGRWMGSELMSIISLKTFKFPNFREGSCLRK